MRVTFLWILEEPLQNGNDFPAIPNTENVGKISYNIMHFENTSEV